MVAEPHARSANHTDALAQLLLQRAQQLFSPEHCASQAVADAHGHRRDIRSALLHHIEMRIERRGLEDFSESQAHLFRQGGQMRR